MRKWIAGMAVLMLALVPTLAAAQNSISTGNGPNNNNVQNSAAGGSATQSSGGIFGNANNFGNMCKNDAALALLAQNAKVAEALRATGTKAAWLKDEKDQTPATVAQSSSLSTAVMPVPTPFTQSP